MGTLRILSAIACLTAGYGAIAQTQKPGMFMSGEYKTAIALTAKYVGYELAGSVFKPVTEKIYRPDPVDNNVWNYEQYLTYSYNIDGRIRQVTSKDPGDQNISLITHTFYPDAFGHEIEELYQQWDNDTWENNYKYTWTYDENEIVAEELNFQWLSNAWIASSGYQFEYQYDGVRIASKTIKSYHSELSNFVNSSRDSYTYDANGHMTRMLAEFWTDNRWEPVFKENYSWTDDAISSYIRYSYSLGIPYDSVRNINISWHEFNTVNGQWQGLMNSYTKQIAKEGDWINQSKYDWVYDNYGGSVKIIQVDDEGSGSWSYESRITDSYDAHNNYTGNRYELWNEGLWEIMQESRNQLYYNGDENLIVNIDQELEPSTQVFTNQMKYEYSNFLSFTALEESAISQIEVFPNPAEDMVYIKFAEAPDAAVEIFDLQGRKYACVKPDSKQCIDISGLAKGIYMLKIRNNNEFYTAKIIKE